MRSLLMFPACLVGMWVAVASAQPAPAPAAAAANPVDPAAIEAVKAMGTFLQTLKRFSVSTELVGERVLADGQKLEHSATASMDVQRPDRIRVDTRTASARRVLTYDGKAVTLYMPDQRYYSSVPFTGSLDALVNAMETRFGVQLPLQDLFLWGTPAAPMEGIESAMSAGQDIIDGVVCDHYAFRQGKLDWQIWIQTGAKPLPRRLVITNRADEARPQSSSSITWNLQPGFKNAIFTFVPPSGAQKIELVPLKKN